MQTHVAPPFKGMGSLIHIVAWGILIGLPFFFTGRETQEVTVESYVRSIIVPISFMIVFYVNYFFLVKYFLYTKHGWKFFLSNVILIATAMILVHLLMHLLPPPEFHRPRPAKELQEVIGFFIVNAMLYALVAGLSVAIKMTSGWYQVESARRELEKSRAEAELQNLKSQLNPHFLFNTLNNTGTGSRARPEPPAPLRTLRKQPTARPIGKGTRLHPQLCGTDAYPSAGKCGTENRNIRRQSGCRNSPAPVHFADRECLQAWRK